MIVVGSLWLSQPFFERIKPNIVARRVANANTCYILGKCRPTWDMTLASISQNAFMSGVADRACGHQ